MYKKIYLKVYVILYCQNDNLNQVSNKGFFWWSNNLKFSSNVAEGWTLPAVPVVLEPLPKAPTDDITKNSKAPTKKEMVELWICVQHHLLEYLLEANSWCFWIVPR